MNYSYDKIGNLKKDIAEGIDTIRWTVYGKINKIVKGAASTNISYNYDASGNRTVKEIAAHDTLTKTFYVRDAQGNVMAVYKKDAANLKWSEQHLYGSSRLGMWQWNNTIPLSAPNADNGSIYDSLNYGSRNYELTNHLGNILATISDKKIGHPINDTTVDYFNADVVNANDYYPGGMTMPGRAYSQSTKSYRYGFNGKENDNEVKGEGNQQDYGMRIYDPRLVRFLSVDPIAKSYPELTPYQFASNSPIEWIDIDGLEKTTYLYNFSTDKITKTKIEHPKAGPLGNGVLVKTDFGVTNYFYGNESPSLPALLGSYEGVKKDKEGNHIYYLDKKNIPTIGYGHRVYPKDPYKPGSTLTEPQAINLFYADQNRITSRADEFLKGLNLTASQRNALYELSFNGGAGKVLNFKSAADGKYGGENYFLQPKYLNDIDANVKRRYADNLLYSEGLYLHLDKIKSSQEIKKIESFLNPPKKDGIKK